MMNKQYPNQHQVAASTLNVDDTPSEAFRQAYPDWTPYSFLAASDKLWAVQHILLIDEMCRGKYGGNLYNHRLSEWCERDYICHVALASLNGPLLGGLAIAPDASTNTASLTAMGVAPHARGKGIADALLVHALKDCRRRGFRQVYLIVRYYSDGLSKAPYKLYLKHGFSLETGFQVTKIGWDHKLRHLWMKQPDPGGIYRSRRMFQKLEAQSPSLIKT